jgi:hypothetical protein
MWGEVGRDAQPSIARRTGEERVEEQNTWRVEIRKKREKTCQTQLTYLGRKEECVVLGILGGSNGGLIGGASKGTQQTREEPSTKSLSTCSLEEPGKRQCRGKRENKQTERRIRLSPPEPGETKRGTNAPNDSSETSRTSRLLVFSYSSLVFASSHLCFCEQKNKTFPDKRTRRTRRS